MSHTSHFPRLDIETAPSASRALLQASVDHFGFLPSPLARTAASPALLRHLLAGFAAFDQTGLTPVEREVVAMTVAFEHGCEYCMALHSAQLTSKAELAPLLAALRTGSALPDPRLEAVRSFVKAIASKRAQLTPEATAAFLAAGFQPTAALEVLLGTCVYITSTLINRATCAELDAPLRAFAWEKP
jgi:AhpD family alkylhydroperoxidase